MTEIILKILDDCDPDIESVMLAPQTRKVGNKIKEMAAWTFLPDPAATILAWQTLREDRKATYLRELNMSGADDLADMYSGPDLMDCGDEEEEEDDSPGGIPVRTH